MELADKIAGLVERLNATLSLLDGLETGRDCEDYAFAKADKFQAMTYCPEAFEALRCIPEAAATLTAQAREIDALKRCIAEMERIIKRALLNTPEGYASWHKDARTALGGEHG